MGRALTAFFACAFVVAIAPVCWGEDSPRLGKDLAEAQALIELREDVHLLNLINGLYLTRDQMERLIPLCRQMGAIKQWRAAALEAAGEANEPVLRELRETLMKGPEIPEDLKRRVRAGEGRVHQVLQQFERKRADLVGAASQIINENQICLIEDFKPCLIPPYSPNTIPIGASSNDLGPQMRILESVRAMPEALWQFRKRQMVDGMVMGIEHIERVVLGDKEKEQLMATLEEARRLSELEWAERQKELAEKIKLVPPDTPGSRYARIAKLADMILSPRLAPIFEQRLAQGEGLQTEAPKAAEGAGASE